MTRPTQRAEARSVGRGLIEYKHVGRQPQHETTDSAGASRVDGVRACFYVADFDRGVQSGEYRVFDVQRDAVGDYLYSRAASSDGVLYEDGVVVADDLGVFAHDWGDGPGESGVCAW